MANLISDEQRAYLESMIDNMHDTFARDIVVNREATKVIISTDPNYNFLYKNVNGDFTKSTKYTAQYKTLKARILYEDKQREQNFDGEVDSQIKVNRPMGQVRIKLNKEGYDYFKGAKRVDLDGMRFYIDSTVRPHGLFSPKYYTFYLRPVESYD
jgi:hypothetical protein